MISNLNVRSKLFTMVTPALVSLCVLGGLGVQSRLSDQRLAAARRDVVAANSAASTLLHEVQLERVLIATHSVIADAVPLSTLAQQQDRTDAAATRAKALVGSLDVTGLTTSEDADPRADRDRLVARISSIASVRSESAGKSPGEQVDRYDDLADGLITSIGSLEFASDSGASAAVSRHWMAAGIEAQMAAAAKASLALGGAGAPSDIDIAGAVAELSVRSSLFLDSFAVYGGAAGRDELRAAQQMLAFEISNEAFDQMSTREGAAAFSTDPVTWPNVVAGRLDALTRIEAASFDRDLRRLEVEVAVAQEAARLFAASVAATLLLLGLLSLVVSRDIIRALRRLTDSAREITKAQLPALVDALKTGTAMPEKLGFTEIDVSSGDEFAEVGRAINELGRATAEVAAEQHRSMRKGIGDIFVNLARRNQSLLDRQIQFIDRLEENEQDADQLEHLFKLDHLATRMRRNADSLLVLAGAEAQRRRPRDVSMSDVIRIAVGEVEEFSRISLAAIDPAEIRGDAGSDVTHLLAELMENGTQYSPPERNVDVIGHRVADGGYVVAISDQGVGMSSDRIAEANAALLNPPPVGLAMSRSLGFVVAATLAARHGVTIRLSESGSGGLSAQVTIPAALMVQHEDDTRSTAPNTAPPVVDADFTGSGWTLDGEYVAPAVTSPFPASGPPRFDPAKFDLASFAPGRVAESVPDAEPPARLADAVPAGDRFEAGLNSLLGIEDEPRRAPSSSGSGADLPQRQPGATASSFESPPEFLMASQTREPDDVRSVLSRYRSGLVTGRADAEGGEQS